MCLYNINNLLVLVSIFEVFIKWFSEISVNLKDINFLITILQKKCINSKIIIEYLIISFEIKTYVIIWFTV